VKRAIPLAVAIVGAASAAYAAGSLGRGEKREITVTARQYAFDPPRIHVNKGDEVHIRLVSDDVVHGFYLEGHDVNETILPQAANKEVVIHADRRGKFRYRCSQTCGSMHPFMTGELIVGPNTPLHAGLGGIVGLSVGLLMFFALTRKKAGEA
jgi:cytochrome c oxidase subunit 2